LNQPGVAALGYLHAGRSRRATGHYATGHSGAPTLVPILVGHGTMLALMT